MPRDVRVRAGQVGVGSEENVKDDPSVVNATIFDTHEAACKQFPALAAVCRACLCTAAPRPRKPLLLLWL
jgi:hypothetical protein